MHMRILGQRGGCHGVVIHSEMNKTPRRIATGIRVKTKMTCSMIIVSSIFSE